MGGCSLADRPYKFTTGRGHISHSRYGTVSSAVAASCVSTMTCSQQWAQGCQINYRMFHHLHTKIADTRLRSHMGICLQRENTKQRAHWRQTKQNRSKVSARHESFPAHDLVPQSTEDIWCCFNTTSCYGLLMLPEPAAPTPSVSAAAAQSPWQAARPRCGGTSS